MEGGQRSDCLVVFKNLVKAQILFEFKYYEKMKEKDVFIDIWDYEGVLFSVDEMGITFADVLL